jgi:NAD(P)-dependent dehydrogenase (short-subunit alcohol dehydrogenase family)
MSFRKLALVTGANRGIGFEIVRQLSKHDFQVVLAARNRNAGERAVSKLNRNVSLQTLDVSDEASIQRAAKKFGDKHDHLDVLVNNAGIYPDEGASILTIRREQLNATFQTNTFGALQLVQAFLVFAKGRDGARDQRLQRIRKTRRFVGRCSELLSLEISTERSDNNAGSKASERGYHRQFDVSWLGPDGYGRPERVEISRRRSRYRGLVGNRCSP